MRKTKTHNVLRRLLAFVLIVSLLPLGYETAVLSAYKIYAESQALIAEININS